MSRVKLPHEVAEALKHLHLTLGSHGILAGVLGSANSKPFEILKEFIKPIGGFSVLLECLVNGYEVEETPEDRVRQYYQNLKLSCNWSATGAIENVFEMLNIKIKGVTDCE